MSEYVFLRLGQICEQRWRSKQPVVIDEPYADDGTETECGRNEGEDAGKDKDDMGLSGCKTFESDSDSEEETVKPVDGGPSEAVKRDSDVKATDIYGSYPTMAVGDVPRDGDIGPLCWASPRHDMVQMTAAALAAFSVCGAIRQNEGGAWAAWVE